MASVATSFEAGTVGTTITTGNSGGSGDTALDAVQAPGTGSTLQFDNTHAASGSQALKIATTNSDTTYVEFRSPSGPTVYTRVYMWWDSIPSANTNIQRWLDSANANKCFFRINATTGKIQWFNAANGTIGSASTNGIPTGQFCRVEVATTAGTAGSITADLYFGADPNSTTPTETMTLTNVNIGANDFARYRLGMITSVANIGPWWVDAWAISTDGAIGPVGGTTQVSLSDSGAGTDFVAITVPVSQAETGVGADAASISASVPLTEAGSASDTINVTIPKSLSEAGTAADAVVATAAVPLTEAGSAADTTSIAAATPLSESGSASDAIAVSVPKSLSDSGSGSETVTAAVSAALADAAAATEQIALAALVVAAETATAVDAISVQISVPGQRPGVLGTSTGPAAGLTSTTSHVGELTTVVST